MADLTKSTLMYAFLSSWWLPLLLVMISTPSSAISTWRLHQQCQTDFLCTHTRCCEAATARQNLEAGVSKLSTRQRCHSMALFFCPLPLVVAFRPMQPYAWDLNLTLCMYHNHLFGVHSSSQISEPMQVSSVEITPSPNGTVLWWKD